MGDGFTMQPLWVSGALALQKWTLALLLAKVSSQTVLCCFGTSGLSWRELGDAELLPPNGSVLSSERMLESSFLLATEWTPSHFSPQLFCISVSEEVRPRKPSQHTESLQREKHKYLRRLQALK